MDQVNQNLFPHLTLLIAGYGRLKRGFDLIEVKPLIRIPEPPKGYVELKCYIHGLEGDAQSSAIKRFYSKFSEFSGPNGDYISDLLRIRRHNTEYAAVALVRNQISYVQEGFDPIERIEIRESDGKKHGNFGWMLLTDFEFFRDDGELKRRKIYLRLYPERLFEEPAQ